MARLVLELIRPYRLWLIVVFVAMLFETAMSIAAPWPLKIIIDNVVGEHKLPEFLAWLRDSSLGEQTMGLAAVAAAGERRGAPAQPLRPRSARRRPLPHHPGRS